MNIQTKSQKHEDGIKVIVAVPDVSGKLIGYRMFHKKSDVGHEGEKKVGICSSVLAWDVEQNPIEGIDLTGFHTGWQDFFIHYDLKFARPLNWLEDTLFVMGHLCDHSGKKVDVSPSNVLDEQIKKLNDTGYEALVATELEFYLIDEDSENKTLNSHKRHDYRIDRHTNNYTPFFNELCESLSKSGIKVESWQSEWGIGQWEVNLSPGKPNEVAESHLLFKLAVTDIASKYGYKANFMAKPFSDQVGSSCHVHISLQNSKNKNVFYAEAEKFNISTLAQFAVQGLLHYTRDLLTLYAGNINSYKRLVAKEFCGNGETWGIDNRTTTCRVIGDNPDSLHIEFRLPGADANPYFALAGVLTSVRKGLEDSVMPQEPLIGDAASNSSVKDYPLSLTSAVNCLTENSFVKNEIGANFLDFYLTHLRHEQDEFDKIVTEWEFKRYCE